MTEYKSLRAGETCLMVACSPGQPAEIIYWGQCLKQTEPADIACMLSRQHAPGSPDQETPASLLNETGSGFAGPPGFAAHRHGRQWASRFLVTQSRQISSSEFEIECEDQKAGLRLCHSFQLEPVSQILRCQTRIENLAETELCVDLGGRRIFHIPPHMTRLIGFSGRWACEFQCQEVDFFTGAYLRENRRGRTSHDAFPGLIVKTEQTHEAGGACYGFHLGWSGNHRLQLDRLSDGRVIFQAGELFLPGEVRLAAGETYTSPDLYAGYSAAGLNGLSQNFHRYFRQHIAKNHLSKSPRPVHFNTWEALYFNHEAEHLTRLVRAAATMGAERFILDDGWFGARRHDRAGLGDWDVSLQIYPEGLGPLIEQVNQYGMQFGLWFEPEMVNPDSQLYRQHPDWVLRVEGQDQIESRGQYVLDLTRAEVSDYLFEKLDALLCTYPINYIKWDMNRDIHHPDHQGRAVAHAQTLSVYRLIDRLRENHSGLEIESCASGGGRADYGILKRTDRIWTSDSHDVLDRQRIQRGASYFFPPEIMGSHIGPDPCHITGRRFSMSVRVATALFGHMGMELDLLDVSEQDGLILKQGVDLYKTHRALIHSGRLFRLQTPAHALAMGVVSEDRKDALFSWCQLTSHKDTLPSRFHPIGLDPDLSYRVRLIWPDPVHAISHPSTVDILRLEAEGAVLAGDALMHVGLQLPLQFPETALIFHFKANS